MVFEICISVFFNLFNSTFYQVFLSNKGTWRIVCHDPDPVLGRIKAQYLEALEVDVQHSLTVSAHFFKTGRVCAQCSVTVPKKMRRCPCKGAYYCGKECQKAHWVMHREVCGK